MSVSSVSTGVFLRISALTISSRALICSGLIASKWLKSKAQALAVDQRALLLDVLAQYLAQCSVQQVGGRVVQRRGVAHVGVDLGFHRRTDLQAARCQLRRDAGTRRRSWWCRARQNGQMPACRITAVADLAARFGVERRLVQDNHALIAFIQDCRPTGRLYTGRRPWPGRGWRCSR